MSRANVPPPSDDVSAYLERDAQGSGVDDEAAEAWSSDRHAFELQLDQLGTQLSESLIQKQELEAELDELRKRDLAVELAAEKERVRRLLERIEKLEADGQRRFTSKPVSGFEGWESIEDDDKDADDGGLRRRKGFHVKSDVISEEKDDSEGGEASSTTPSLFTKIRMTVADRLSDFTDDDQPEKLAEDFVYDYPLTYKRLKSNLKRFTENFKLIGGTIGKFQEALTWKSPLLTLFVFFIYMYSVWTGYLLHILLLLCIGQIVINWLIADGLGRQLGFGKGEESASDDSEETTEKSKMQLVLNVARQVQNKLALAADGTEKIKNLLTWRHREAGKKLLSMLTWAFLLVLLLSPPMLFRVAGLGLGIKVFIIGPIFKAFPKVERRYGSMAQLYRALPTDAQLKAFNRLSEEEKAARRRVVKRSPPAQSTTSMTTTAVEDIDSLTSSQAVARADLCAADVEFCRKLVINPPEPRLPPFSQKGLGCSFLEKGKSFLQMPTPGKLHLTHSFLCFLRAFAKNKPTLEKDDYVLIPLCDITSVKKAKPISLMPGKGFALEISVLGRPKPYLFGAIMKRDEGYEGILNAGKAAGLDWAAVA